jgi:hypothetical protein
MMVAITVITASVLLAISAFQSSGRAVFTWQAYDIAESGLNDALMNLLRNPYFTTPPGGSTLTVGDGIATIRITGTGGNNVIVSSGQVGSYVRTVRAETSYNGSLVVKSWRETFP